MGNRRGRRRRRKTNLDRHADPSPDQDLPSRADHIAYIADMLRELKIMSARADCPALTELLELAYREAAKYRAS